jgi:hypothetical protein
MENMAQGIIKQYQRKDLEHMAQMLPKHLSWQAHFHNAIGKCDMVNQQPQKAIIFPILLWKMMNRERGEEATATVTMTMMMLNL